jgi:hypothetical protein
MKWRFAVVLLLVSFASAALAEGPGGMPPPESGTAVMPPALSIAV